MSGQPITEPIRALSQALFQALAPVVETYKGLPAYYWTATGPLAVRCIATSDDAAQDLAADAVAALGSGVSITGYRLSLVFTGELVIPPLGGRYTAALRYDAEIRRI